MAAKPFESRIQNLVYNVEAGIGLRIVKTGTYIFLILIVGMLYVANEFRGLREAEAMEYAQLARNYSRTSELTTQVIRPGTIWHLVSHKTDENPQMDRHPDILHPPVYPLLLGTVFKLLPDSIFDYTVGHGRFKPEQAVIIPMGLTFVLLTGLFIYLLGKRLFEKRVALLATTLFFTSNMVWHNGISGLPINIVMFFTTLAFYTGTVAITNKSKGEKLTRWLIPFLICCICVPLAFLTRYCAWALLPCVMLFIGLGFKKNGYLWSMLVLMLFGICVTPWIARNMKVSGAPFGAAFQTMYRGTPYDTDRNMDMEVEVDVQRWNLKASFIKNLSTFYNKATSQFGDGLISALFIATYFFRFLHGPTQSLRWGLLLGLFFLFITAGLFGEAAFSLLHIFWPVAILYGCCFFFMLLDRLEFTIKIVNMLVIALVIVMSALPLIFIMLPPRAELPAPYYPNLIATLCKMVNPASVDATTGEQKPAELLCTDIPWATAWYGDADSLLLPADLNQFYNINDYTKRVSGLYLSTVTLNKPMSTLLRGSESSWFRVATGQVTSEFPLVQRYPLGQGEQVYLTDRDRWSELENK